MWRGLERTDEAIVPSQPHRVSGRSLTGGFPPDSKTLVLGMGCFWGAERVFWQQPGVWVTAVGYAGGGTRHPNYQQVCTGQTGHAEVVRIVYRPSEVSTEQLLVTFFENHDPTQGMRQGNDVGPQYRSIMLVEDAEQFRTAVQLRSEYSRRLGEAGFCPVSTELDYLEAFYFAEDEHQQYLERVPNGYCGLRGTGVSCPTVASPV